MENKKQKLINFFKWSLGFLVIGFVVLVCGANFLHNTVRPSPEISSFMNKKIDEFHQKLIQEKFAEIYLDSDTELKKKFKQQEFIEYLRKAKEHLGEDLPKTNVNSHVSLSNTLGRKLGNPIYQMEIITISEKPNYKSEIFQWKIYSKEDIRLVRYEY